MADSPIKKAKRALSGKTTAARLKKVEKKKSTPKKKAKPKAKLAVIRIDPKHAANRQAKIKKQQASDRAAIAAKRKKK